MRSSFVFFFKQKTAYEMRISDWSSDVCSSDLGAAILDVVSPCVAFNNHKGSTRSYDHVREHNEAVNRLDFVTGQDPIEDDYEPGATFEILEPNGTTLRLAKIDPDYDPTDKIGRETCRERVCQYV